MSDPVITAGGDTGDGTEQRPEQPRLPASEPDTSFDAQYRSLLRAPFAELANREPGAGGDSLRLARDYAERGKPDYVLAYLLACDLSDEEKRELFAHAYERRAALTEQRARQFSQQFNRPFPLLFTDAATDRAQARRIRLGRSVQRGAGRPLPTI